MGKHKCLICNVHFEQISDLNKHIASDQEKKSKCPICEAVVSTSYCFKPNQCLSKREVDLLRDLVATFYDMGVKIFDQIPTRFGSLSSFMQRIGLEDEFCDGDLCDAVLDNIGQLVIEDYKVSQKTITLSP